MPAPANLVHEFSTSNGLGDFTLVAVDGKQTFNEAFGTGGTDLFDYFISSRDNTQWEYGTGHLLNATTLVRDTVIESSNSDNPVNFTAGTTDVTNDVPADNQARIDGAQTFTGVKKFAQNELEIGAVSSPTDLTADQGGLRLKGDTDKIIKYDNPSIAWIVDPAIETPIITVNEIIQVDAGNWDEFGINLAADKEFTLDGKPIIKEAAGTVTLSNVGALDSTTEATIEDAIDTLANLGAMGSASGSITGPSGTWDTGGMDLASGDSYAIDGEAVITDSGGFKLLSNIDILDSKTEATIENFIDTLSNLTTIQNRTITLDDAGTDAIFGWDDSVSAYKNLVSADATAILNLATTARKGLLSAADKTKLDGSIAVGKVIALSMITGAQ